MLCRPRCAPGITGGVARRATLLSCLRKTTPVAGHCFRVHTCSHVLLSNRCILRNALCKHHRIWRDRWSFDRASWVLRPPPMQQTVSRKLYHKHQEHTSKHTNQWLSQWSWSRVVYSARRSMLHFACTASGLVYISFPTNVSDSQLLHMDETPYAIIRVSWLCHNLKGSLRCIHVTCTQFCMCVCVWNKRHEVGRSGWEWTCSKDIAYMYQRINSVKKIEPKIKLLILPWNSILS